MMNTQNKKIRQLPIIHNNKIITNQNTILILGVLTNYKNTYDDHLTTGTSTKPKLLLTLNRKLNLLKKIRYWVSNNQLRTLANGLFHGQLSYGLLLWGLSTPKLIEQVKKI